MPGQPAETGYLMGRFTYNIIVLMCDAAHKTVRELRTEPHLGGRFIVFKGSSCDLLRNLLHLERFFLISPLHLIAKV